MTSAGERRVPSASGWSRGDVLAAVTGLVLLAIVQAYVALFGTAVAFHDDLTQVGLVDPDVGLDPAEFWHLHNEHRLPLPRLVFVALLRWTHDFRTATLLGPWLLAASALAFALAARRVRGTSSACDAFFPLAFLSLAQCENLLNGFQLAFLLPFALGSWLVLLLAGAREGLRGARLLAVGALSIALSLCGAFGLFLALGAAVVLGASALARPRDTQPAGRATAGILAAGLVVVAMASVLRVERRLDRAGDPEAALAVSSQFLAQWTGVLGQLSWPWSGILAGAFAIGGLALAVARARSDLGARPAWLGLAALLAAHLVVALAIGFGRGGEPEAGFISRYATLSAFGAGLVHVAAGAMPAARQARIVQAGLCALALVAWIANVPTAVRSGHERAALARALEGEVGRGRSYSDLADAFAPICAGDRDRFELALRQLDRLGLAPFARPPGPDRRLLLGRDPWSGLHGAPYRVDAPAPPRAERWHGAHGLLVVPGSELVFDVPGRSRVVRGLFGIELGPDEVARELRASFVVEVRDAAGSPMARHERRLGVEEARAPAQLFDFGIDLGPAGARTLVLRFAVAGAGSATDVRGFWGEVRAHQ